MFQLDFVDILTWLLAHVFVGAATWIAQYSRDTIVHAYQGCDPSLKSFLIGFLGVMITGVYAWLVIEAAQAFKSIGGGPSK